MTDGCVVVGSGLDGQLRRLDLAGAVATAALLAVVALDVAGVLRILLALVFVTFLPGWALLGHSDLVAGGSRVAIATAVSLSTCVALTLAMAWLGSWHPLLAFYVLGAVTLLALGGRAARPPRRPAGAVISAVPEEAVALPELPMPRLARSLMTLPENLRFTGISVGVTFLPRPPFGAQQLTEFFAGVHEHHPFTSFRLETGGGAVMETVGSRNLRITPDSVVYAETGATEFRQARTNAVELLLEVQHRLGIPVFANPSCRLDARWDAEAAGHGAPLLAPAGRIGPRPLDLLGSSHPVSVGIRLTGTFAEARGTWVLGLEPRGEGGLAATVEAEFSLLAENAAAVGDQMARTHQFLTENVVAFVDSLADPTLGGE